MWITADGGGRPKKHGQSHWITADGGGRSKQKNAVDSDKKSMSDVIEKQPLKENQNSSNQK